MDSWNLALFSFLLLILLSFCTSTVTATSSHVTLNQANPIQDIACLFRKCGQGTCKASNNSLLGFDCECLPGWRKIQIGPFTFPSCLIPNCTVDFECGNGSPSRPPPPASLPRPANLTTHCDLVWCGDGKCVTNGTGHICQCNQGSQNLLNSFGLACFKPCYFGADCQGLGLDLPLGLTQPPPPPPPSSSLSSDGYASQCAWQLFVASMVALAAAFLSGF
ncbi:uncharacterized protein LOC110427540 [Herrania umbratica]|uniref:Uncharacterized protein LOC110427540 n=1 Tax=Herrania umbratica TaxID=108875 RepID=A0A6J1BH52_9ROSI|nr:uncharacterized protein LOC110427540 [Herrania umbratica]